MSRRGVVSTATAAVVGTSRPPAASGGADISAEIPQEIQLLGSLQRAVAGLTVIVTDSACAFPKAAVRSPAGLLTSGAVYCIANAFEMSRVLNVKNRGVFHQGWLGDIPALLESIASDSPARPRRVLITWTLGQMFSIVGEDLKQRRWAARGVVPAEMSELPWLPSKLRIAARPGPANTRQITILTTLLKAASEIVSAVEPDATGELIFRDLLTYAGNASRPFKRAWIRSRTDSDLIEAFSNLMDGRALDPLATFAGLSRATDHLTGVNYSALLSGSASPRPDIYVTKNGQATVRALGRSQLGHVEPAAAAPLTSATASTDPKDAGIQQSSHAEGSVSNANPEEMENNLPLPEEELQQQAAANTALVAEDDEAGLLQPTMKRSQPIMYKESVYNVGRIQMPILRMIVERFVQHYQIAAHQPEPAFGISLTTLVKDRSDHQQPIPWVWCGRDRDISRTIVAEADLFTSASISCRSAEEATEISKNLSAELRVVQLQQKTSVQHSPRLFNLATLQAEASQKLDLAPHSTLVIAMQLFEARVISFPKTSNETLPLHHSSEFLNTVLVWSKASRYRIFADLVGPRAKAAAARRDPKLFKPTPSHVEHHAIVPVLPSQKADAKVIDAYLSKLNEAQKRLLDLVVARLFEACMPDAETQQTEIVAVNNNVHYFSSRLSVSLHDGWRRIQEIAVTTLMGPGRARRPRVEQPERTGVVIDQARSSQAVSLLAPVDLRLGDVLFVDKAMPPTRVFNINDYREQQAPPLVSDSELVKLMADPSSESPGGLGIADVATRSGALQQLIHWKYVSHKNGVYTPTRRGIRLVKLLADEPVAHLDHLAHEEILLRHAALSLNNDFTQVVKASLKATIAPLLSRSFRYLPYDLDTFHTNRGSGTFEMKLVRSETCPKCRTKGTLIMGITAIFCSVHSCNFACNTTIGIHCAVNDGYDHRVDLVMEMSTVEKVRLVRGERVPVPLKRVTELGEIRVEVQPPQLIQSSAPRALVIGSSLKSEVPLKTVEAYLDPNSRYELTLVDISNPSQRGSQILPPPGNSQLPSYVPLLPAQKPLEATEALRSAIRGKATAMSSLWDEWVGDAEYVVPPIIPPGSGKSKKPTKPQKKDPSDPQEQLKLRLDALKIKRRLAVLSEKKSRKQ